MNEQIFDKEFYEKLEKVSLMIQGLMTHGASGSRKSKAKGMSVEFSDFREYTQGDDFRRIDWNAYGRFKKLYVKLFIEEREAIFNIFIDTSCSMNYGTTNKSVTARRISAIFTYLALKSGDKVNIYGLDKNITQNISATGKTDFYKCLERLKTMTFNNNKSDYEKVFENKFLGKGISIIISDFFTHADLKEVIKYLSYKKQQVIIIQILATEELRPELEGRLRLLDSESKVEKNIHITSKILNEYKKELKNHTEKIKEICTIYRAIFMQIEANENSEKELYNHLIESGLIRD